MLQIEMFIDKQISEKAYTNIKTLTGGSTTNRANGKWKHLVKLAIILFRIDQNKQKQVDQSWNQVLVRHFSKEKY